MPLIRTFACLAVIFGAGPLWAAIEESGSSAFSPTRISWLTLFLVLLLAAALVRARFLKKRLDQRAGDLLDDDHLSGGLRLRQFVAVAPTPMAILDSDQNILFLNDSFTELFGYDTDDLPDIAAWWQCAYPDEEYRHRVIQEFEVQYRDHIKKGDKGVTLERMITCKDDSVRYAVFRYASFGEREIVVANDITDLKGTEIALRQSEARLKAVFNNLAAGIEILDRQGRMIDVNDRLAEMLGYQKRELLGRSPLDFTHPEDLERSRDFLQKALAGQLEMYRREKRYLRKDGSSFWADLAFTQIADSEGENIADIGIIFDITEHKQLEQKLREANRELEEFVYSVSHDLRTPLTPLLGYAEFLRDSYRDCLGEQGVDVVDEIEKAGQRLLSMIEDLLGLACVGELERPAEAVDLKAVIKDVLQGFAPTIEAEGVTIEVTDLPDLRVPETLLFQIFENLIGNALRYAGRAGSPIEVGGEEHAGMVRLFVRDHGDGIPTEERSRVFNMFYRRAESKKRVDGTGIGLAIVQKVARLYGGKAWVEETPGGGATFLIEMAKG